MKVNTLLSSLVVFSLTWPLPAQVAGIPDFSKGMPDAKLESKLDVPGEEAFVLSTGLRVEEFSAALSKFLGEGWVKRANLPEKTIPAAASMGLTAKAEIDISAYEHPKLPGVQVEVMHVMKKEGNADSRVTIRVTRPGSLVRAFGSSQSPDGTKRLEVKRRDKDLVDFEVFDSATGKKLAGDSIGWSAMRWFLYWENSSKLWGYGSDISYFKIFEFKHDGTVTESEVDETMTVPAVLWNHLPSSLQRNYKIRSEPDAGQADPPSKKD